MLGRGWRNPLCWPWRARAGLCLACIVVVLGLAACRERVPAITLPGHLSPFVVSGGGLAHDALSVLLAPGRDPARPALSADERALLARYLATLARTGPTSTPELFTSARDRLAFLVNAHVAWTLALHDSGGLVPEPLRDSRRTLFPLDRGESSLEALEQALLDAAARQPRIVLCLNPGLAGAPPLPAAALSGHAFDWQLRDHAGRCGGSPGFWELTVSPPRLRVTGFTEFMPGLAAQRPARMRELLALVPPPPPLLASIVGTCGETLSRCTLDIIPLR